MLNVKHFDSWQVWLLSSWNRITTPRVSISDPGALYKARLLASVFLAAVVVVIIFTIIPLAFPILENDGGLQTVMRIVSTVVLLFCYDLSRQGRPEYAVGLGAAIISGVLLLQAVSPGGFFGVNVAYFLGAVILMCGLFSHSHITLMVFAFQLLGILVLLPLRPDVTLINVALQMLFIAVMTFFTLVGIYYRQRMDSETNARIQQSEARYRALVNSISDIIYTASTDGTILSVNPAISEVTGWSSEEMIGSAFTRFVHPDDVPIAVQSLSSLDEGEIPSQNRELRIVGKDGKYRWVEVTASLLKENGRIVGMNGSARDITARKLAEQIRQQSEKRLSMLIQQIPLAMIELDLDGVIVGWNPAAETIFGYSAADVLGKNEIAILVPDELQEHVLTVFADLRAGKHVSHGINECLTHDGRTILCEWYDILLTGDNDEPVGMLSVASDITERRQSEEQRMRFTLVHERMSVLKTFMHAISHDFRTALSLIETSRYLVEHTLPSTALPGVQSRLDTISGSVRHMETQLVNLDAISALTTLDLELKNVNDLVTQVVYSRQTHATSQKLALTHELSPDLPPILIDEVKLNAALSHLLDNALVYTPAGGSISVRTTFQQGTIQIAVTDTGIGIAPKHIANIFDLFYRVDSARPLNTGGVGLGLTIARLVAEAHDGSLAVKSMLGQGSTFTISLPVKQPPHVLPAAH